MTLTTFLLLLQLNPIVFLLGGQSNMDGAAKVDSTDVHFYELPEGVSLWENGKKMSNSAENKRIGPEYGIALELKKLFPNREIWLIKRAVGGVSLYAWSPFWSKQKADSTENAWAGDLYASLIGDVNQIVAQQNVEFGGLFWMQGERDAKYRFTAERYQKNLYDLLLHFRKETKPNLPFILGRINPPTIDHPYVLTVRKAQESFAMNDFHTALVTTDDLPKESDRLHYNVKGVIQLGARMVQSFDSLNQQKLPNWEGEGIPASYWSSADESLQKAMIYVAKGKRPLVVVVHTWRGDWTQSEGAEFLKLAKERNWHFIHPDNRGANDKPESVGSQLVMDDMESAVRFMSQLADVDSEHIFLVGASGGGFVSLHAISRVAIPWKAVSVWVPISDLTKWHSESEERGQPYARLLEQATGGKPSQSFEITAEYELRSPITYLKKTTLKVPLHIHVGIEDGHKGSVPISHSLRAYNAVANEKDRFTEAEIELLTKEKTIPKSLKTYQIKNEKYGKWDILLRRQSGLVTLTLFNGAHDIHAPSAFKWFDEYAK